MKKILLLSLMVSIFSIKLFGIEDEYRSSLPNEEASYEETSQSMLGWGVGLAVVIAGLAAIFGSGSSSN